MRRRKYPAAVTRRLAAALVFSLTTVTVVAQPPTIADFFDRFTADWIRGNPDQAIGARYFIGEEQRGLERQLTPVTAEWAQSRRDLARRELAEAFKDYHNGVLGFGMLPLPLLEREVNAYIEERAK